MRIIVKKKPVLEPEPLRLIIRRQEPKQRVLTGRTFASIDPGVDGTGWGLFFPSRLAPVASGSVSVGKAGAWGQRATQTARDVHAAILDAWCNVRHPTQDHCVSQVFIEEPQFMEGGRGIVAARSGDLVKLCLLAGMIGGEFSSASNELMVHFIEVREWKGSMPKDVTAARVMSKLKEERWRPTTDTTHEMDAVGLGLFVKGVL